MELESDLFDFGIGGRQVAPETPSIFNEFMIAILEPRIKKWEALGYGVLICEGPELRETHDLWADTLVLLAVSFLHN